MIDIGRYIPPEGGFDKKETIQLLIEVTDAHEKTSCQKGAIVDMHDEVHTNKEFIFIGDLHGRYDNFKEILSHDDNAGKIQRDEAVIIILGDAVHAEIKSSLTDSGDLKRLRNMQDSIVTIEFIMSIKREYPDNLIYCLGNHDYFTKKYSKGGVVQGWEFRDALKNKYGEEIIMLYERFIASSPLLFIGNGIVANHAGPFDESCALEQLLSQDIAAQQDLDIVEQSVWRRWKHYNAKNSYNEEHVTKFLTNSIKQPEAVYLVGHSPNLLYYDEYRINDFAACLMKNHYMIFAGYDQCGYARFFNGSAANSIEFIKVR
ncbi:metallophosphoesterase [Candidatus Omnitrophota bacterium]